MKAFIDENQGKYGVEPICKVLPIAPSTYYAHAARQRDPTRAAPRARRDVTLSAAIRRVFEDNLRVYGVRKGWRQLQRDGTQVARCTVARLMRAIDLKGVVRGKPIHTTISHPATPYPHDLVERQFHADRPNALWVADFTYVTTWQGVVYVALSLIRPSQKVGN